jgi:hypothetical protein
MASKIADEELQKWLKSKEGSSSGLVFLAHDGNKLSFLIDDTEDFTLAYPAKYPQSDASFFVSLQLDNTTSSIS